MNTKKVISAVHEIERNQDALKWLDEFGDQIALEGNASIDISANLKAARADQYKATSIMEGFAIKLLPQIVETAKENCRNTIEILKQQIADELK